jgi:hypothetical protein
MLFVESSYPQSSHIALHMGALVADIPNFAKRGNRDRPAVPGQAGLVWPPTMP